MKTDESLPSVHVREVSAEGHGLFAGQNILKGTKVIGLTGKKVFRHEIDTSDWSLPLLQIEEDAFLLGTGAPDDFINHGCEPNLGLRDNSLWLYALRDIKKGEELSFDYSLFEDDPVWSFACQCASPLCRGEITGFGKLPPDVQVALLPYARPYLKQKYQLCQGRERYAS